MKRSIFILTILWLGSVLPLLGQATANGSSWYNDSTLTDDSRLQHANREFYVTFLSHNGKFAEHTDFYLSLYATSTEGATVVVEGWQTQFGDKKGGTKWTKQFTVPANGIGKMVIPHNVGYLQTSDENDKEWLHKGLIVKSDKPITLYSSSSYATVASYDATRIYPIESLNREYVVQTFSGDDQATEFAIVSTKDDNNIELKIRETPFQSATPVTTTKNITLQKGESYLYTSSKGHVSLSGTSICADHPIAVFQGGQYASVPIGSSTKSSHIYTQAAPTDSWGMQYIVTRTAGQTTDIVQITAAENGTEVYKNGKYLKTLGALETYTDAITWGAEEAVYYNTTKATACYIYLTGRDDNPVFGSPSVTDIAPLEQSITEALCGIFQFRTTENTEEDADGQYVNIVVRTSDKYYMQMDGNTIGHLFKDLPYNVNGVKYSYAIVPVQKGTESFELRNDHGFVAHVYGRWKAQVGQVSYSYTAGRNPLHSMWMTVNGIALNGNPGRTLCVSAPQDTFKSVINFNYSSIKWEFDPKEEGALRDIPDPVNPQRGPIGIYKKFEEPGETELLMIVGRKTPICGNDIFDTVKMKIMVLDTFLIQEYYRMADGSVSYSENVCYGEEFVIRHGLRDDGSPDSTVFVANPGLWQPALSDWNNSVQYQFDTPYDFNDKLISKDGCDSLVNRHFVIRQKYDRVDVPDTTVCQRELPFTWTVTDGYGATQDIVINMDDNWKLPIQIDTIIPLQSAFGCDSILYRSITINPSVDSLFRDTICEGEVANYIWHGRPVQDYFLTQKLVGRYHPYEKADATHSPNASGCDTIFGISLLVLPEFHDTINVVLCKGEEYTWLDTTIIGDGTANSAQQFKRSYPTEAFGVACDSIFVLNVLTADTFLIQEDSTICANKPFIWFGHEGRPLPSLAERLQLTHDTIYEIWDSLQTTIKWCDTIVHHCDSVHLLRLIVHPVLYDTIATQPFYCYEDRHVPYGWNSQKFADTTGIYFDTVPGGSKCCGCDSILVYNIRILPINLYDTALIVCEINTPFDFEYGPSVPMTGRRFVGLTQSGVYNDTLRGIDVNGCDSIIRLHLDVYRTPYTDTTIYICSNDSFIDPDTKIVYNKDSFDLAQSDTYIYKKFIKSQYATMCDSVVTTTLIQLPSYDNDERTTICPSELPYNYPDSRFTKFQNIQNRWGIITGPIDTVIIDTVFTTPITTKYGDLVSCDSIIHLHLHIDPVSLVQQDTQFVCLCDSNYFMYGYDPKNLKRADSTGVYYDTLTAKNHWSCDSIWIFPIVFVETDSLVITDTICSNHPYDYPYTGLYADLDSLARPSALLGLDNTGIYRDTLKNRYGCDSIIVVQLQVNLAYDTMVVQSICDNEDYDFNGHLFCGDKFDVARGLSARPTPYSFDTTLYTIHGCDSVIHLLLTIHPTYLTKHETTLCQAGPDDIFRWIDDDGRQHGQISIAQALDTVLRDTLSTMHGCDSVFTLDLHILPHYQFDSTYTIYQNERIQWQGRGYRGSHFNGRITYTTTQPSPDTHTDKITYDTINTTDRILPAGCYYDTIRYTTVGANNVTCDSIFCLTLNIRPTYDTIVDAHACDTEGEYTLSLSDSHGTHRTEHINITRIGKDRLINNVFKTKEAEFYPAKFGKEKFTYKLKAVEGGDSIVYLHLTVHPSYHDTTYAEICDSESYEWRDSVYRVENRYYQRDVRKNTTWGCDSLYVLDLYIRPAFSATYHRTICNNETLLLPDTAWHSDGSFTVNDQIVWKPGDEIPSPDDTLKFTKNPNPGSNECVRTYIYKLTVNPAYHYEETATICSNEQHISQKYNHTWQNEIIYHKMGHTIAPYHAILTDSLSTITGCDSVFVLHATVYPAYKQIDTYTLCQGDVAVWGHNGQAYKPESAGDFIYADSLQTIHGCDSIYEFHIHVNPVFLQEDEVDICADSVYIFHGRTLNQSGFYDTTFTNIYGCDSIYWLNLNVRDTTNTILTDTICHSEHYTLPSGREVWESGFYKDTSENEYGCHHFTYLTLCVIEPTKPIVWSNQVCANDPAYDLYFTYTNADQLNHRPLTYSLLYDSVGLAVGFQNVNDAVIDSWQSDGLTGVVAVDIPQNADSTQYVRPDRYSVQFILHNGVCQNDTLLCSFDTSIIVSYPSWVTEQRFGDAIGILSAKYNGGYQFSAYQWYRNNIIMPGETKAYLYLPQGFEGNGTEYSVMLTREGESEGYPTCPIVVQPRMDEVVPQNAYLSVVPTHVVKGNPVVNILCRETGTYNIFNAMGAKIMSGTFEPGTHNAYSVTLPQQEGVYIFHLHSDATVKEPNRTIRVIVGN